MLLRSSSTPVLGSLLSPSSDSPNNFETNKPHHPCSENLNKISFLHGGHSNFHPFSCNSSPISHSPSGFRRVRSDGNLEALAGDMDDFRNSHPPRSSRRPSSVLETIPSFSIRNSRYVEEEEEEEEEGSKFIEVNGLQRSVTIGENITSIGGDLSFSNGMGLGLVGIEESGEIAFGTGIEAPSLFLARGLGIDVADPSSTLIGGGSGGGSNHWLADLGGGGGDGSDIENYYKKMVEENPCNGLFLRNYAQFLYQTKGDFERAEEYYGRAILVEPSDGEILSQYAKLIWEHHHDQERASSYFEQAIQAAPSDSHVLAAYASFLWETEDNEESTEEAKRESQDLMGVVKADGAIASSA
ncbi:RNA-processing protein [Cinnamomum micranthum f. kanehirae]|uniref:RNA-processing protein n=1 Tax=Cinnamomum micranthum f. kanehirae TaxID=337451 RepID=A0A3S4PYQ0_9MAGN|nr:RNA-processing protein [Cinnamomum micranthum f. kanehirae]